MATQMLGVRLAGREEEEIKKLVEAGLYVSVSEFIRDSVRKNLASLKAIQIRNVSKSVARKEIINYSDSGLDLGNISNYDKFLLEIQKIYSEVYRVLKPAGIFALWNVLATDETEQSLFAAIIREKDRLAGFDSLARDRYLQREDQVRSLLKNAGFDNVERVWDINYNLSTYKRLDAEFGGDRSCLESWNNFIRNHFPEHLRQRFSYVDVNGDIMMQFKQGIIRCVKPLPYSQNERRNS